MKTEEYINQEWLARVKELKQIEPSEKLFQQIQLKLQNQHVGSTQVKFWLAAAVIAGLILGNSLIMLTTGQKLKKEDLEKNEQLTLNFNLYE